VATRTYGQFCGLARALELIGERWGLLVVRDLILGPKRFTDLRRALPRIPTNVLAARLKHLEEAGVVRRRALPRPGTSVVYELTEYGEELREIVLRLGLWGARSLGHPRPDDILGLDSLILALQATFRPERARGLYATYELRVGPIVIHARVIDGTLDVAAGPLPGADLVLETGPALKGLMAGEISPAAAIASGGVRIAGNGDLLERFVECFHIPPKKGTVTFLRQT
jgi:DNA-binding HxlR family transcriptional regulator